MPFTDWDMFDPEAGHRRWSLSLRNADAATYLTQLHMGRMLYLRIAVRGGSIGMTRLVSGSQQTLFVDVLADAGVLQ